MTGYWVHAAIARQILAAMARGEDRIEISVDLNLSRGIFPLCGDELILDGDNRLSREALRKIEGKENRIFYLENGHLEVLEARGEGYYKLVPTDQAPLLEISGVKMHIAKGVNPFESAGLMAALSAGGCAAVVSAAAGRRAAGVSKTALPPPPTRPAMLRMPDTIMR